MSKTKTKMLIVGVIVTALLFTTVPPETAVHGGGGAEWEWQLYLLSGGTTAGDTWINSVGGIAGVVQTYIFGIVLTVTFITMILSGIKFGLAKGDVKAFMEAKRSLLYSVIAFVLAMGAFLLRRILLNALGAPDLGPTRSIK